MTIKFPTTFAGFSEKQMEEEYNRIVNAPEKQEQEAPVVQPTGKDLTDFIYVPSINLYVAKERTHLNKKWFDCHKELQNNKERMLIIPEFIEFLKYLKNNSSNQEYQNIYKDITEVRNPWRAEWLDADFKVKGEKLYINYNHVLDSNGPKGISSGVNLIPKNSKLLDENTLMQDKTPGISLEDYLNKNHTNQGLPNKNVSKGSLYYWNPESDNNSVARFYADSVRAILYCGGYPSGADSDLGVHRCKVLVA